MADRLERYRGKRDFGSTPEPAGDGKAPASAGRFVVQEHDASRLHWDLRLEHEGTLASWALPRGVPEHPKENRLAVHTEDHPLEYLEFEGEIPKGEYGGGTMRVWDSGTYDAEKFRNDEVIAEFHGERVRGRYALIRTRGSDWLIHRMDPPDDPGYEPLPEGIAPMQARAGSLPRDESAFGFEVKWDGIRALAYCDHGHLTLQGRNFTDFTSRYPELRELPRRLGAQRMVLDGEVVALDEQGRPSFERLQSRMHLASESAVRRRMRDLPVNYVIFDLLYLNGHAHDVPRLRGAPGSARAARARGSRLAHARLPPGRGQRPARGHRGHGRGGRGGQAPRLLLRARPALPGLDQGEERGRAGRGDRGLDAGHRAGAAGISARSPSGSWTGTGWCTRARWAPGSPRRRSAS